MLSSTFVSPRRTSLILFIVLAVGVIGTVHAEMGESFISLPPAYAQHVLGATNNFRSSGGYLGGVVVLQTGHVVVAECQTSTTRFHVFSTTLTYVRNETPLHAEIVLPSGGIAGGCGIAWSDGALYSNMNDGTRGVSRIDVATMSVRKMGPPGNALGIAADPVTGNIVYAGAGCKPGLSSSTTCTIWSLNPSTATARAFATLNQAQFGYIHGVAFDPSGAYLFLTNRTTAPAGELDVLDRSGAVISRTPISTEPLGIAVHAGSPNFVLTNNADGTLTQFDFPDEDYSQPPSASLFASGGSPGNMMQTGADGCLYLTQLNTRYNNGLTDKWNSVVQICGRGDGGFARPPGISPNPEPQPSSLCGSVYHDANNDGRIDSGETGINGVNLTLSGTNYVDLPITRSARAYSDGSYCFGMLPGGQYTITEEQPGGYLDGKNAQGTPGTGTVGNGAFTTIVLEPGVTGTGNNFGELLPSSLGGFVYVDADNDGVKGIAEAGIAGMTVTLTGVDDRGASVTMPATTGVDGAYLFTNLRPGTYSIVESQPPGVRDGKDMPGTPFTGTLGNDVFSGIIVRSGIHGSDNNFGELPLTTAAGN